MSAQSFDLACDAVLFDLDGVLVDSEAVNTRHWRRWAAAQEVDVAAVLSVMQGRRTVDVVRLMAPHLHAEEEAARIASEASFDVEGLVAMEGAEVLLRSLPEGCWAIVTSGMRNTALTRLRHAGLPVPDILVTADDVAQGKPHPEPYLRAAAVLEVPPARCIVIEDAPAGLDAAQAAGMPVVALATTHRRDALLGAEAVAGRLLDIEILPGDASAAHRLRIRVQDVF